ncbi:MULTISPECIES: hypothetical protein [Bradyrhizobium]|uniref:hypothetical protein n=1 Tax=Bradyrhizobium TaxID=374 RepID=UPI0018DE73A8|nr:MULTISPECIES: hypothetical protein [Bradyrhizobium]
MSAVTNLLARRQQLLRQLESGPTGIERDEIERQLAQIDTALDVLEWLDTNKGHSKP